MQLALMHLSLIGLTAAAAILRMHQPPLQSQSFHLPVLQHLRAGLWERYTPLVTPHSGIIDSKKPINLSHRNTYYLRNG